MSCCSGSSLSSTSCHARGGSRWASALKRVIEVLELLVEAAYTRNKETPLRRANLRLETVRHLWRVGFELNDIATRQYEHGAKLIDGLGRQIGGWLRSRDQQSHPAHQVTRVALQ